MRRSVVLVMLLLAACAGVGTQFVAPRLSFVRMRALEASLFEQRLELRLRVQNPNSLSLPIHGIEVDVELAGEHFAHGVAAREFTVPANGEAEFDMLLEANAANALIRLATADRRARAEIEYRLHGQVTARLGLKRRIPFEETGTLPLRELLDRRR